MQPSESLLKTVTCPAQAVCGGCTYLGLPLGDQIQSKIDDLTARLERQGLSFPSIEVLIPGTHGLRDRLDFTLEEGRFGLMRKSERQIEDLSECSQLSPPLAAWLQTFRQRLPPVRKGSVRLRVAPDGTRGMWLDFSNIDIKGLLDEKKWLDQWGPEVRIEIGQRLKCPQRDSKDHWKLKDPSYYPWFSSQWNGKTVELFGLIGGFTQPGLLPNQLITSWIQAATLRLSPRRITEFGSGQGNLSFPALSSFAELTACESDELALKGFRLSLENFKAKEGHDLTPFVKIEAADFLRQSSPSLRDADLLIANPPRSGLQAFLEPLTKGTSLRDILYMSCYAESFTEDSKKLRLSGFHLRRLAILDQFPQTKHYEIISEWSHSSE